MAVTTGLWSARRLLLTMSSQSASTFANQVVAFVIPWLVLSRTGSALNAGGVAFATGIASVLGTLFGGVIVDRIGGRRTAIVSDALSLVTVLALVVALAADFVPLWLIVVTQTLGVLFDGPGTVARDALLPRVAREDAVPLVRATSLQETLQNTAQFVGPLAAGFLVAAVAERGTLLVAAAIFAAALALIAGLERQRLGHDAPLTPARALADVREGFRFIAAEPLLGPLTFLLVAWVAVYLPLSTLVFPAWFNFARQSAGALGVFLGAQALGAILGGLVFAAVGPRVSRYYSRTPEELLGRVNGTSFAMVLAALPFSSLAFGWLINATSPETAIAVVVAANTLMVASFALLPAMRLLDRPAGHGGGG